MTAEEIEHGRRDERRANRSSPFVEEAEILAEHDARTGLEVVGAEGLEPPTYAL
jgi:hypothetical protein